jgi:hypothetical protein
MNFNLLVTFLDGSSQEVSGIAADLVAFEAQFDLSVASLGHGVKITHLLWLAWHVQKRTATTALTFEKWVETVSTVEAADPKK